ncbi:MAG: arginine--tRNA ligase [Oligoflexales bacterium]
MSADTPVWVDPAKKDIANLIEESILKSLVDNKNAEAVKKMDIYQLIEKPPETHLGDFALPCFRFAKVLKKKPFDIAVDLKAYVESAACPWVNKIEIAGAFLNLFLDQTYLANFLVPIVLDESYFDCEKPQSVKDTRVMVEFSQPNTHKEFHIGHCRNVCLGESVSLISAYNGFQVIPVNYIGDEGTHVAKCLWQVSQFGGEVPSEKYSEWYGKRYAEAHELLSSGDEEQKTNAQKEVSKILAAIESKEGSFYELWKKSRDECMQDFGNIYKWLGVKFDHIFYESDVSQRSQEIVDEYIEKGLFKESEGAYGVSLEEDGLGFFMARKSDGTSLYITKDLALAKTKFEDFTIDKSVYVVGSEQNFHFRQLFKTLELMGFEQAKNCYHLSYAHVTLPHGKISSRKGNAVTFSSLVELILDKVHRHLEKYADKWTREQIADTAQKLAVSAIKYGMLSADPQKEIVFDVEAWTSFDGNSGPYLMYSYARTCSILRECDQRGYSSSLENLNLLTSPYESELLRYVYDFNGVVMTAGEHFKPSMIANFLFSMCKGFNRFYANLSVIKADSHELIEARMSLISAFSGTLKQGLRLLGMHPVERM